MNKTFTEEKISELNKQFSCSQPEDILKWALDEFGDKLALACSFGVEDVALVDMAVKIAKKPRIFVLDTGRLHEATYLTMESCRLKYNIEFETYFPDYHAVEKLLSSKGPRSFNESVENRHECCNIRKVEPLKRALSGLDAWVTGLRREQSAARADVAPVMLDSDHGSILKINPLFAWKLDDVVEYNKNNRVPVNQLFTQGYPSIGCEPCTRAVEPGADPRSGRWWWEQDGHKECGLHQPR